MGDQRFRHRIGLRKQFQNPLQIQLRKFTIITPLQGGAVELISHELGFGGGRAFDGGMGIEHGKDGRMYGPLDKTFGRP